MKKNIVALATACLCAPLYATAQPTIDQKIEALQQQIEDLKAEVARLRTAAPSTPPPAASPASTAAPAAARSATSIFGYGEFNYNRYRDSERTSRADLRRFVLGFGHRFDERLSFMSEVELEHAVASAGDRGEVEVEQAYLNYQVSDALNVKGGLFLIPAIWLVWAAWANRRVSAPERSQTA